MSNAGTPDQILEQAYAAASAALETPLLADTQAAAQVSEIVRSSVGAGVRLLIACCLAKVHNPNVDIRHPYTELGEGSFSGRAYDEQYVTQFIHRYDLPCNPTTAFLTPALRAKNVPLLPGTNLGGRNREPYDSVLALLDKIERGELHAKAVLRETVRMLLRLRLERQQRIESLLGEIRHSSSTLPLSSEDIVRLIEHHLAQPNASRLPVLLVAAAYKAAMENLGEQVLPLKLHNAADERMGAIGDVEIALKSDFRVVTAYEMKLKPVTIDDVNRALQKVAHSGVRIDNYVFVTTDVVDPQVLAYVDSLYRRTGGIEFVILNCVAFLRHFLHLFHRLRLAFLNIYQQLLLDEPESAVRQPLKEVFLALRHSAESGYLINDNQDE